MADGFVQVQPDSTGKKVDVTELTVGGNTVERQRINIAGLTAAALLDLLNSAPAGTEYAIPVRNIPSGTQPISAASLPLPTGAAQDSTLSTLSGKFTDDVASTAAASESATSRLAVAAVLRLLDTSQSAGSQLVAAKGDQTTGLWVNVKNASIPVTGTFWQATQPVSGTFWQATQPISAASLPLPTGAAQDSTVSTLSGKFTDDVASTAAASESATSRLAVASVLRLLDTSQSAGSQLVIAKGDQTTGLWVNIKNASIPVTGTFWQATQPVSGTFWQATQPISAASLPLPTGAAQDSTLSTLSGKFTDDAATTSAASESATSRLSVAAVLRLLDTSQSAGSQLVAAKGDQTTGLWVNVKNASLAVTGTFWQATQPVSAASLPLPTGAAQDSTLSTLSGKFTDDVAPTSAASESATSRLGTAAILRLLDTAQAAGSQLVAAKGDQTSGLWVNVKAGNVGLNAGTNYVGKVRQTDGTLDLSLLNSAPGSDTGQISVPVRVISSLAAGGSSGPTIFNHTTNATITATTGFVRYDNLAGNIVYFTFRRGGSATGTGLSLTVNVQDLDPQTGVALGSQSFNSQELAGATNATFIYFARSTSIQVKFVVAGVTPSFTQVYLTGEVRAGSAGIEGAVPEGTDLTGPIKPNPILIAGSNGGLLKAFATDGQGTMQVVAGTGGLYSHLTDGTLNLSLLNSAPGSDSGQTAVPVRVISQLGAGSGGGTNDAAANAAASESATTRAAVTAVLRLLDTGQAAGSQLVTAKGDQTTGLWVNVKNASLAVTGTVTANQGTAAALASAWPTKVTDGTNTMPTADAVGRALFAKITDGTNTMPTGDAVARAIFHKLTDGTNTATVRAGSSLPAAADTALVVTTRDLITVQGNQPAATTGSITAANSTVSMSVNNINVVTVTLSGATFAGVQFVFEGSADSGTTWSLLQGSRTDTGLIETGTSYALGNANGPRSWDIPIGGLTNIRVRATAWTSGTATITMIGQVFAYDPAPTATTQPRRLTTYSAGYRLGAATAGQVSLTFTFTANTEKQLATIYHLAASTKIVRIRKISVWVSTGALGVFGFEVKRLSATTTPATGNPAITPGAMDSADGAAEATCLALPTTAGALSATDAAITPHFEWNSAAVAAPGNPSGLAAQELVLYDYRQCDERKPLTMRAGVAEGFAVIGRCTTAVALRFTVHIEFTEEAL